MHLSLSINTSNSLTLLIGHCNFMNTDQINVRFSEATINFMKPLNKNVSPRLKSSLK